MRARRPGQHGDPERAQGALPVGVDQGIKRKVEHSTFAHYSKAKFYKVDELTQRVEMDMDGGPLQNIPLQESELTDDMLRRENCLMFKKTDWVRITSEVDAVQNLTVDFKLDFKNITITSALDQTPYNFYEALLDSTWLGFCALDANKLRDFYDMVGVHPEHDFDEVPPLTPGFQYENDQFAPPPPIFRDPNPLRSSDPPCTSRKWLGPV